MLQLKQLEDIGIRIRKKRKAMKITQVKAADLLGISVTHYRNIERGKTCMSLPTFIMVCEQLNLDATYILTGKDISENPILDLYDKLPPSKRILLDQALFFLYKLYE